MPVDIAPQKASRGFVASRHTVSEIETADAPMIPRPAYLPEEGHDGRSEWFTLLKAVVLAAAFVTIVALVFVR